MTTKSLNEAKKNREGAVARIGNDSHHRLCSRIQRRPFRKPVSKIKARSNNTVHITFWRLNI